METLKRKPINESELTRLLDFYELRTLKERVKKNNLSPTLFDESEEASENKNVTKTKNVESDTANDIFKGTLFDLFAGDGTDDEKKSSHLSLKEVEHTYKLIETEEDITNLVSAIKFLKQKLNMGQNR